MNRIALLLLSLLFACRAAVTVGPSSPGQVTVPDTIYTASGALPIVLVDSIAAPVPGTLVIGQLDYLARRLYVSRAVKSPVTRRKTVEHERCHAILVESGLAMHFREAPWLAELLCDAFASAAINQLERGRP